MTEHTPEPWKRDAYLIWSPSAQQVVCAIGEPEPESGNVVYQKLQIGSDHFDTAMANAKFIVRACNSHADLLEALEAINNHWESGNFSRLPELWEPMRLAIEQAKVKKRD